MNTVTDWTALTNAWLYPARRMQSTTCSESDVAAGGAAHGLRHGEPIGHAARSARGVEARHQQGLDAFEWGFAMLWFTGITPFMLTMLAAFAVCLAPWTMIVVRRNGRERHHLEQLKCELADL
jgi:hypothetical protein